VPVAALVVGQQLTICCQGVEIEKVKPADCGAAEEDAVGVAEKWSGSGELVRDLRACPGDIPVLHHCPLSVHERKVVGRFADVRAGPPGQTVCWFALRNPRRRRLLLTTNTDENAMAAPAIIGLSRPSAASGRAATL
jgi:hypothetical protein